MADAVVPDTLPAATPAAIMEVRNPADGSLAGKVALDSLASCDATFRRAAEAFADWRRTLPAERAAAMRACAAALRAHAEELARIMAHEAGKPVLEGAFEVEYSAATFDFYAGLAEQHGGRIAPPGSAKGMSLVVREPLGVVAALVPWNYPLLLWAWKAAPALAAGNTVVAKPSPTAPLSLARAADLLPLPEGVHQVLQGDAEVGTAMMAHPDTAKVAFTGSTTVGKAILAACAVDAKRCSVEMSGHDAAIVWDDVDLDLAVEAVLFATFTNAGQVCTSAERIYVRDTIAEEFAVRLAQRAGELVVGDPLDPATDIGPLASEAHLHRIEAYVRAARERGARVLAGGGRLDRIGAWFAPTVLAGLAHEDLAALGEIFGPVAPVVPIATFEEGIARASDSRFGLSANVITSDLGRAMQAARELQVGTVWINNPLIDNLAAPFGGFREAGIGRELGEEGLHAFTEAKHVWIESELTEQYYWFAPRKAHLAAGGEAL